MDISKIFVINYCMDDTEPFKVKTELPEEVEKYLEPGEQTKISPEIQRIADSIEGNTLEKAQGILNWGRDVIGRGEFTNRSYDKNVFRKRTAEQILKDRYLTGCTDYALLFITIARACGIPAKYVETIDREWLEKGGTDISGHVYAQIYDEEKGEWVWVDPRMWKIGSSPKQKDRIVFKEGLDSWDIGIRDKESMDREFGNFRDSRSNL